MDVSGGVGFIVELFGALQYRAKKDDSAATYLKKAVGNKGRGTAFAWAFLAMTQRRQGQPGDRDSLQRARDLEKYVPDWYGKVAIRHILREVEIVLKIPTGAGR